MSTISIEDSGTYFITLNSKAAVFHKFFMIKINTLIRFWIYVASQEAAQHG